MIKAIFKDADDRDLVETQSVIAIPPIGAKFSFVSNSSGSKIHGTVIDIDWVCTQNDPSPRVTVTIKREYAIRQW